jgi:Dimerisation domain
MARSPNQNSTNQVSDRQLLSMMMSGGLITQLIHVAAQLGIADVLAEGAHSSEALAHRVGAHPHALYRVLRALAGLGLFAETPEGRFEMTSLALPLQTNAPESLRALAIMWGERRGVTALCAGERGFFPGATPWRQRLPPEGYHSRLGGCARDSYP